MTINIRKATAEDLNAVSEIYRNVIDIEEKGTVSTGWERDVYPTLSTAEAALKRDDLFVEELDGEVVGTAILNHVQVDVYENAPWQYAAEDNEVMVIHTLAVRQDLKGMGLGKAFVDFYEKYALENGCHYLRMDTNERNTNARKFYNKLNYKEIDIVPCKFNGIEGVHLVLLEKKI